MVACDESKSKAKAKAEVIMCQCDDELSEQWSGSHCTG